MQAIKELSSFFNTVRQAIFRFKPKGFDSRKANPGEKIIGVDIAIMSQVAKNLGKGLEIKDVAFDTIPILVKTSTSDTVGASALIITEDRKDMVDFSLPYCTESFAVVSHKDDSYTSISALDKATKVGYVKSIMAENVMQEAVTTGKYDYDNCTITLTPGKLQLNAYQSYEEALAALEAKEIDAFVLVLYTSVK